MTPHVGNQCCGRESSYDQKIEFYDPKFSIPNSTILSVNLTVKWMDIFKALVL